MIYTALQNSDLHYFSSAVGRELCKIEGAFQEKVIAKHLQDFALLERRRMLFAFAEINTFSSSHWCPDHADSIKSCAFSAPPIHIDTKDHTRKQVIQLKLQLFSSVNLARTPD